MRFRVPASVDIIKPKSRDAWLAARRPNIGASVVGALLGVHSYTTLYEQWALKSGAIEADPEETPAMRRGRHLEPVAIELLREDFPRWKVIANPMPGGMYFVDRGARLSATPDAFVIDPDRAGYGVVQIKSVDGRIFREGWRDPDTQDVVPPLWIGVQAIFDAHLSGASWAAIGALVVGAGLELHIVDVPIHPGIVDRVREAAARFWPMVDAGTAPDPDFARDGETIAAMFGQDNGETIDLSGDNELPELVDEYESLAAEKAAVDRSLKIIKAAFLSKLGNAAAGRLADGRVITAKTVNRAAYSVAPSSYRSIRIKAGPIHSVAAYQGEF
ncbi:endonuclease [Kaistia algarum]|uniref:YqaJ viral recombinase family nuclease n=1 Tax=Kaistia algarum TaxID=2083279 RepID=UPI000CE8A515|nr:YqaJ viral recombinase family protein [Kaistia algarum]MCX5516193.1 YqaJ viral recombinase family protein [Kaistia algarum]PPE78267.1 endonuclease [Kaistia algarum]